MIRVIQRRLIIPRGDTGTFTLPLLPGSERGDVAVFSIYDPLKREVLLRKETNVISESITFIFNHDDTAAIEPSDRYEWDVRIYHEPDRDEDGNIVSGKVINSYYSAFRLPICEISLAP